MSLTFFLNAALSLRHITAASILAGESSLGSDSIEITDTMMDSTPRIGRHRSIAVSYAIKADHTRCGKNYKAADIKPAAITCSLKRSSPGGCRIEIQTFPSA